MIGADKQKFTQVFIILAEVYNRKLSTALLHTYWNCLRVYPLDSFEKAFSYFLKNPDNSKKGFPSPAEWIKAIEGDKEEKSLAAWMNVMKAVQSVGQYDSVDFGDRVTHRVIKEMGGWVFLCQCPMKELYFLQKEFERRYRYYYSSALLEKTSPCYLVGHIERQNAAQGFLSYIPKPVVMENSILSKYTDAGVRPVIKKFSD